MRLTLASASPRRRELLALLGLPFDVLPSDVDESLLPNEEPRAYVERLARDKARGRPVTLAADTSVVVDGAVLGKPGHDAQLAAHMLRRLSGRAHEVLTGIAVWNGERCLTRVVTSTVCFRTLTEAEIRWYINTGEGADKAGGYAIQGRAGVFIESIIGSPTNVIGLPLAETAALLREAGFPLPMDES